MTRDQALNAETQDTFIEMAAWSEWVRGSKLPEPQDPDRWRRSSMPSRRAWI